MGPGFDYRSEPGMESRCEDPQHSPTSNSTEAVDQTSSSSPGFAPSVDVNQGRFQTHWKNMKILGRRPGVHLPRSLEHYRHRRLSSKELQELVQDQVVTRFMKRQFPTRAPEPLHEETKYLKKLLRVNSEGIRRLRLYVPTSPNPVPLEASLEEGQEGGKDNQEEARTARTLEGAVPSIDRTKPPLQILVVPQLWLWKFGSE